MGRLLLLTAIPLLLVGCNNSAENPTDAQRTYGESVDADDAVPAPAVAAEPNRYLGRRVTTDGRITARSENGCILHLNTEGEPPLRIEAPRTDDGGCTWQMPADLDGIAVAAGTLRAEDDTLRLSANGVQVTPVRIDALSSE